MLQVTVRDTPTGKVELFFPVQGVANSRSVDSALTYPRKFRYIALIEGKHQVIEREVISPVTLKNFGTIFGPERSRFRITPDQKFAGMTRKEALQDWIINHSTKI